MIFLKVLAVVLGLAFLLFGYFIYFKKKYNLINGFEADFKAGRKKEEYAKKVGMIEFVVGIVLLITGVALILLPNNFQFAELNIRMIRLRYGSIPIPQILISRPYRPV